MTLTIEADLAKTPAEFACWRRCTTCGTSVLYVDEQGGTEDAFTCDSPAGDGPAETRAPTTTSRSTNAN